MTKRGANICCTKTYIFAILAEDVIVFVAVLQKLNLRQEYSPQAT